MIIFVLLTFLGLYILSFYDPVRYNYIKSRMAVQFHLILTSFLREEQAIKVQAVVYQAQIKLNNTVIATAQFVSAQSQRFYTYVTTDKTIQSYVLLAKTKFYQLLNKLGSSGGGEQKS